MRFLPYLSIMLRFLFFTLLLGGVLGCIAPAASAQNFCPGSRGPYVAFMAGPYADMGAPNRPYALHGGVLGGIGIDDRLYLGLYFGSLLSENVTQQFNIADTTYTTALRMNQAGVWVQWSPVVFRYTRILIGSRFGFGNATWRDANQDRSFESTTALFASPTLSLEFPLSFYVRWELGAGYRAHSDLGLTRTPQLNDVQGVFFFSSLRFGSF
jgi:hypothetical protein